MKILPVVLSAFMMLSIQMPSFAASDDEPSALKRAETLLTDIGIVQETDDYTVSISRGEFVDDIVRLLNIVPLNGEHDAFYSDVDSGSKYYSGICTALELGLISEAESFFPDRAVSYNEAIKIAVSASDYDYYAAANGGYPLGYVTAAKMTGLQKGIGENGFNLGDAYILMYNILKCDRPLKSIDSGNVSYSFGDGGTLLKNTWQLDFVTGTFDGGEYFGGEDKNGVGKGYTSINGQKLRRGGFNTDKFYTMKADAYYNEDNEIVSVYLYDNDCLVLSTSQGISFSTGTYTYDAENSRKSAQIANNAEIIYNGKATARDSAVMVPAHGRVTLKKHKGLSAYDVVVIESYEQIVADETSDELFTVKDVFDKNKTYTLNPDSASVSFENQDAVQCSFSDIQKYNVLWIAESADKEIKNVIICKDRIVGELTGKSGNAAVYIDGGEYKTADSTRDMTEGIEIGTLVAAYMNIDREVAYMRADSSVNDISVGYLISSNIQQKGLLNKIQVKLLTKDGDMMVYDVAERFYINGIFYGEDAAQNYNSTPKDLYNDKSLPVGIVGYVLNNDAAVSELNYPDSVSKDFGGDYNTLYERGTVSRRYLTDADNYVNYRGSTKTFSSKSSVRVFTDSKSVQFIVPDHADTMIANDKDFNVKKMSTYPDDITYLKAKDNTGYSLDKGSYISNFIVTSYALSAGSGSGVEASEGTYMVEAVKRGMDEDGVMVELLELVSAGNEGLTVSSDETGYFTSLGLERGDLVKVAYNNNKKVNGVLLVYKAGQNVLKNETDMSASLYKLDIDDTMLNSNLGMGFMAADMFVLGNAYDSENAILSVLPANKNLEYNIGDSELNMFATSLPVVLKYSLKDRKITSIDMKDIRQPPITPIFTEQTDKTA